MYSLFIFGNIVNLICLTVYLFFFIYYFPLIQTTCLVILAIMIIMICQMNLTDLEKDACLKSLFFSPLAPKINFCITSDTDSCLSQLQQPKIPHHSYRFFPPCFYAPTHGQTSSLSGLGALQVGPWEQRYDFAYTYNPLRAEYSTIRHLFWKKKVEKGLNSDRQRNKENYLKIITYIISFSLYYCYCCHHYFYFPYHPQYYLFICLLFYLFMFFSLLQSHPSLTLHSIL